MSIKTFKKSGIGINVQTMNFANRYILGLDGQDYSIFEETLKFVKESGLSEVQITIQTPFPGTELYKRLKISNRLIEEIFWDKRTLFDVTYSPDRMTINELESEFNNLMKELYSDVLVRDRKEQFIQHARKSKNT